MARARIEARFDTTQQIFQRCCDRHGCSAGGEFRAPRSREHLSEYYWFCLEHVREYNAAWNYYAGMSEAEVEAELRRDTTWQRPSWPLGSRIGPLHGRIRDQFGFFGDGQTATREAVRRRPASPEEQALRVFDLDAPFTLLSLKARYKELVKRHHPDANGGDKAAEEKLKVINQAYSTLKAAYFA